MTVYHNNLHIRAWIRQTPGICLFGYWYHRLLSINRSMRTRIRDSRQLLHVATYYWCSYWRKLTTYYYYHYYWYYYYPERRSDRCWDIYKPRQTASQPYRKEESSIDCSGTVRLYVGAKELAPLLIPDPFTWAANRAGGVIAATTGRY